MVTGSLVIEKNDAIKIVVSGAYSSIGIDRYMIYMTYKEGKKFIPNSKKLYNRSSILAEIDNLNHRVSTINGSNPRKRKYSERNQYTFEWKNYKEGYTYRIWIIAVDYFGNVDKMIFGKEDGCFRLNTVKTFCIYFEKRVVITQLLEQK